MGMMFSTENAPAKRSKKLPKGASYAKRPKAPRKRTVSSEGARRFDFCIVSLPVTSKERNALMKDPRALLDRVRDAVRAGDTYQDFAASPQEEGRAVFMLRKAEGEKKYPPVLMRFI